MFREMLFNTTDISLAQSKIFGREKKFVRAIYFTTIYNPRITVSQL